MAVILIVDDIKASRNIYRLILEHHGHSVHEAEDGAVAVGIAQKILPDLVIMDVGIPLVNGYDALHLLRHHHTTAHIRVVALIGHDEKAPRRRASNAGFDGILAKPASEKSVMDLVESLLVVPAPGIEGGVW